MHSLSIVIPAFNEEARLPQLLRELEGDAAQTVGDCGFDLTEAVIVDDGSTDRTAAILTAVGERQGIVRPLLGSGHRGKGGAVATGLRAAQGEYTLLADVDLSTPLTDLAQLGEAIRGGADIAIGSRDVEGSRVEAPVHRRQGGRLFNAAVRVLTGLPLRDTQNGFKLLPTAIGRELTAEQISEGLAYDVELLVRAQAAGLRIAEVPVTYLHDENSRVQMATASPRMLLDVAHIAVRVRGGRQSRSTPRSAAADRL